MAFVSVRVFKGFNNSSKKTALIIPVVSSSPSSTPMPSFTPTPTIAPKTTRIPMPTAIPTPTLSPTPTPDPEDNTIWESIAACETNGNWIADTGNGYFGGLQFSQGAWNSVGGGGNPAQASKDEQITRGKMLQKNRGWGVWGACAQRLGLN